jgi:threonine dehydrogenase-like Zn-dependent dehydrogenase
MPTTYEKVQHYRSAKHDIPDRAEAWNMYGAGLENIGRDNHPEVVFVPVPNDDQLLVRIDSVGLCFSDLKIIKQGGNHPKLYGRDLIKHPTRLGHEVSLTIMQVGKNLRDRFHVGQRCAVQPDIYQQGKSAAYGYTVPGGLIQYHVIGPEVLETDDGVCLLTLNDSMGYAESALLEPWGCVMAAYTQRRRLSPKKGGVMWIVGELDDKRAYEFSSGLDAPATIVLTRVPDSVRALVSETRARIVVRDEIQPESFAAFSKEMTNGLGFDDIVVLAPRSANFVGELARHIARRGTLNLIGDRPLDGDVAADVGRLHYDYIAFVGNDGRDIAASYGEARNRCELRGGGTTLIIGAGGPMGQMHLQRAIELPNGPSQIIATEVSDARLETLQARFAPLAEQNHRHLRVVNPSTSGVSLREIVMSMTDGQGADDVVVCVPSADIMADGAAMMNADGMLILFAGVPNGTLAPLNLSHVFLHNAQFTGTSGLTIRDQELVMRSTEAKSLSPGRSVAAIGGMSAARDGIEALIQGRYAGKIVIFPQISELPLTGLDELKTRLPSVAAKLGPDYLWTTDAEAELIEIGWQPPGDSAT